MLKPNSCTSDSEGFYMYLVWIFFFSVILFYYVEFAIAIDESCSYYSSSWVCWCVWYSYRGYTGHLCSYLYVFWAMAVLAQPADSCGPVGPLMVGARKWMMGGVRKRCASVRSQVTMLQLNLISLLMWRLWVLYVRESLVISVVGCL